MLCNSGVSAKVQQKCHKGFTLIEVILSFALLAMLCVSISAIAMNAINITKNVNTQTKDGMSKSASIENYRASGGTDTTGLPDSKSNTISIVVDGSSCGSVDGSIRSKNDGVTYYEFMPN